MDHFAQSFGSIVGIWTLQGSQKTRTGQDPAAAQALWWVRSFGDLSSSLFLLDLHLRYSELNLISIRT